MIREFYPSAYADSVFQLDYQKLYRHGYRGILFDIDNTLVHHGDDSTPEIDRLFRTIHETGLKTILLSNNDEERVLRFIRNIDTLYICDAGKPDPEGATQSFSDVPTSHSFYKAIQWASEQGITKGYKDGTFGVGKEVTRGQVAMFLWRYAESPAPASMEQSFTDVPAGHSYFKAIRWAVEQGITKGYTGANAGKFGPADPCTRGQCATFLSRLDALQKA